MKLRDFLKDELPEKKLKAIPSSYDVVGSREKAVAIIEIPDEVHENRKIIANALMKIHKNVKTVLEKISERKGIERLREYEIVVGDKNTEVVHKEYGCSFKVDPRKVYFSPREGAERMRIAEKVKAGETVLVMFCGVGPYPVVIARKQPMVKKVVGIEINPDAFNYMVENIKINKVQDKVMPILGNVKEKCKEFYGKCDRVVMPLPKGAHMFLNEAFRCLKSKGIIHFYHWSREDDLFSEAIEILKENAKKFKREIKILDTRKVLPYSPRTWKVCVDCFVWLNEMNYTHPKGCGIFNLDV